MSLTALTNFHRKRYTTRKTEAWHSLVRGKQGLNVIAQLALVVLDCPDVVSSRAVAENPHSSPGQVIRVLCELRDPAPW